MKYTNRLKGAITQSLVKALLSQAKMTVVPLGIEETIREVADLPVAQYLALELSPALRKLPDFFATNAERARYWLIEVKFRSNWSDAVRSELGAALLEQAHVWAPLHVVIFLGDTPSYFNQPSSWVRVATVFVENEVLKFNHPEGPRNWCDAAWHSLERIQDVFPALNMRELWNDDALAATLQISKGLTEL